MSRDLAHLGVYLFFFFSLVCIGFLFYFALCALHERKRDVIFIPYHIPLTGPLTRCYFAANINLKITDVIKYNISSSLPSMKATC